MEASKITNNVFTNLYNEYIFIRLDYRNQISDIKYSLSSKAQNYRISVPAFILSYLVEFYLLKLILTYFFFGL